MKLKRFLSLALAFMMVLSICPMQVFAAGEEAPARPTATVTELENEDLTFALNFKADPATDEQLAYYGDWYADFELTVNKDVTFNANGGADGYLSGQYDDWSDNWVNVPFEDVDLEAGETLKIMAYAAELLGEPGLKYTYREVYEVVKDFDCGVFFTDEFLAANRDIEVTLELRMYNPADEDESYVIGETHVFNLALPTATVTELENEDLTFALNFKADKVNNGQLAYYGDWYADFELTINKDVTFNANGGADGYLSGQYDDWSDNWVNVPFEDVDLEAGETLKIMAYAAELLGEPGLKYTYREVYEVVKDFDCGVFFTDEFLAANRDIEVKLELRMYNPADEGESYVIGRTYIFTLDNEVPERPTATVKEIENEDLTFAMNFIADPVTDAQLNYYGDWYADFELTINKDVTFNANGGADGHLSGQYDDWSDNWVNVPFEDVDLKAGETLKIMAYAAELLGEPGLKYTYREVYEVVKDFDCGVFFTDEFLAANQDIEARLELKMYNPANPEESYVIGETYIFTLGAVAVNVETGKLYNDVNLATSEAEVGQTVKLLRSVNAGRQFTVFDDVTFDLNGKKLTAEYVTSYGDIVDNSEANSSLLVVEARKAHIRSDNAQLPVKTADGYCFIEIEGFNQAFYKGKYVFQPIFESSAHELLKNGKASTEVDVCILVTWENAKGEERSQIFRYNDEMLVRYLNSLNTSKELMFTIALNFTEQPKGLRYQAYVDSGLGVETFSEEPIPHPTETTVQTENTTINAEADKASALVAEGTKLNGTELSLKITELDESNANVTVSDGESLKSVDVHIDGIASSNTVPAIITVKELAEAGLNQGNLKLYHVENGIANEMTQVFSLDEVDAHNEFYYDPATGDVTMALATFSEVAVVAEDEKAWEGNFDYSWYTNAVAPIAEGEPDYVIANADQLAAFGAIVGGMGTEGKKDEGGKIIPDSFAGKTIKLLADINLGDAEKSNDEKKIFYPIGYNSSDGKYEKTGVAVTTGFYNFCGTFDGNGHKISNFYQNTWEMKGDNNYYDAALQYYRDGMGLFGRVYGGTIKNLTVDNFKSDGEYTTTGVIAAYADGATFENIAVTNCNPRVYNIGNGGIVGCVGWYAKEADLKTTFKNITVDNSNKISALWGSYDVACGGIVGQYYPTSGQTSANKPANGGIHFENCHVSAIMDVYNDVCANYQYYAYRYTGMMIGSVRENETIDGRSYPKMEGITAEKSTVNFGTWNDYYYCEIIDNTTASYTHDYQMSRLTEIKAIDGTTITYLDGTTGTVPASGRANYVIVDYTKGHGTENATCYHFKNGEVWKHEDAGTEMVNGVKVLVEDKQHIYLEFKQLFTGYGWGVTSVGLESFGGITVSGITEGNQEESVEKFVAREKNIEILEREKAYKLSEIFSVKADNTVEIKDASIIATVTDLDAKDGIVTAVFDGEAEKWEDKTITFSGTGRVQIIIQDYYFCTPTVFEVEIGDKEKTTNFQKFVKKFDKDFLYRVGNEGTVKLDNLFKLADDETITGKVTVKIEAVDNTGASGAYTSNATWTKGTIQFSKTGVVKVTIKDDDKYCEETVLYLEVVDAVNATNVTSATNATSGNIVLLNDAGLSSLTVSGRYTFYGNGFTLTYTGNGQYLNNGLKQGVVTVSENGTLDNVRIKASIYPKAYLYYGSTLLGDYVQGGPSTTEGEKTRYHYQLSAVVAKGNATISNCYIYGGRNNIFVDTGDVTVKDSVLECGTVANVQIQSNASHTVTFNNVTTISHQVNPTIVDTTKVMLGAGILVGPETTENPTIVLDGYFKQYNWVTSEDANAVSDTKVTKAIIQGALGATAYNHTINKKTASNLGIIYMNTLGVNVTNKTGLPYVSGEITITPEGLGGNSAKGQAYSLQGASDEQIYSDYEKADKTTENDWYQPQFKYPADLGGQYIEKDSGDEHCYREGDTIHVMFPSGDTKELDLAAMVNIVKYSGQNLNLAISCKDGNGDTIAVTDGKVSLSNAGEYTVTYTVTDNLFYDKDGKPVTQEIEYSWDVTVSVSLKDTAVPNAYFEFDASKQKMGYYKPSYGDVKQYLPFLAGLKIYDYNGKDAYLRFNGDSDFNKVASITVTNKYSGNDALVVVKLTDGGVITTQFLARADSGGSSTYTGSIKTSGSTIYFVNDGGTSNKDTTTTAAYWYVDYYKFTGNNGVEITSGQQTFNSTGKSASTPSGSFSTTIKYTVTYDANGGNCVQNVGYATSAATAVTLPTPTRSGYIFAGWYTAASGGTRVGRAGDSYTPSANITLYAQWSKPCTVTYDANGGSCGTAFEKYTGTALTLPTPTRDGYWFIGWYDAAEGGNKIGDAGAVYYPTADIKLYAHWQEAIEYTVTYNANGGSCGTASATYQGTALTLPTPTRTGYTFNGWYTAASGGTKIGNAGATYVPSSNITLYAQWEKTAYKITVSTNNATVSGVTNGQTAYYGDTITFTVSYSGNSNKNTTVKDANDNTVTTTGSYTFTMPASDVTISASSSSGCFTADTLITLADGTQKRVDELTFSDKVLAWDFFEGKYVAKDLVILVDHGEAEYQVANLEFSNGTVLRVIADHGIFDYDLNKFVYLTVENMNEYIGHRFVQCNDKGSYNVITLVNAFETVEVTNAYSITTAETSNAFASGMLTVAPPEDFYNWIEMDGKLHYDVEKFNEDVEKYGLYDYDVFKDYVTYEQFIDWNGAYLRIPVEKGLFTFEYILELIELYSSYMPK